MRCHRCGSSNSETIATCAGCGEALMPRSMAIAIPRPVTVAAPALPTRLDGEATVAVADPGMGVRLVAFCCDTSVGSILGAAVFLALLDSKSTLDLYTFKTMALPVIFIAYMTVTEYYFHGSLGKHLLGIQVQADSPHPKYASFSQILFRESVGKFVSAVVLGIGFLAGFWNSGSRTWADKLAKTVVVSTRARRPWRTLGLALLMISSSFAVDYALAEVASNYKDAIDQNLASTERTVDDIHVQIIQTILTGEPQSAAQYQQRLASVPSLLDQYDRLLMKEQDLVATARRFSKPALSLDSIRLDSYEKVIRLRQQISGSVRRHVTMVLASAPQNQSWDGVLENRKQMLRDVKDRNDLLNDIGGMYVPRKIAFNFDSKSR